MRVLGIDVGGTKIECVCIELEKNISNKNQDNFYFKNRHGDALAGSILARKRLSTEREKGYNHILKTIHQLILDVLSETSTELNELQQIGIGLPGSVDPTTSLMINGNTQVLINAPIKEDLQKLLDKNINIVIENDANCFALAEVKCGIGLDYSREENIFEKDIIGIGIILGTGVGGGCVGDGKLFRGKKGGAVEVGHMQIMSQGHPCYCGLSGCAEQYLSGPAIEALYHNRISAKQKRKSASEIFDSARMGDPIATAVVKEYKKKLIHFLVKLTNVFDPHFFVFGGGMSKQDVIYENLEAEINNRTFVPGDGPKVLKYKLGDSAGVIGASLLNL